MSPEKKYSTSAEQAYYAQRWPKDALPYLHLQRYVRNWLPEAGSLFSGKKVLDIGAGEAIYTRMLADVYLPELAVACELFAQRMQPAKRANASSRLDFVAASCFKLPFGSQSFDTIFGSFVLHQLPGLDAVVSEIERVLKPGGYYVGIEPNPRNPVVLYRFLRGNHSKNQYLLDEGDLEVFTSHGMRLEVRYFYARFPKLRGRLLTTCMGILARKTGVRGDDGNLASQGI